MVSSLSFAPTEGVRFCFAVALLVSWPLKTNYFENPDPAIQLPWEGPVILRVIFLFAKSPKNWVLADNFGHTTPEKMVDASKLGCVSTRNFGSHNNKKAAVVITILRIDVFFLRAFNVIRVTLLNEIFPFLVTQQTHPCYESLSCDVVKIGPITLG